MDIKIKQRAEELARAFLDETEIPTRFKKKCTESSKVKKVKTDSAIELNYKNEVEFWGNLIQNMFDRLDSVQASRFIFLMPQVDKEINKVSECKDFCDFIDYLVLRRDRENCDDEELGRLAMLSGEFQKRIEKHIKPKNVIHLKSELATSLLEKGKIVIDGIEVNLWRGHTIDTVSASETWNKIKSFTELNNQTAGENGSVVFTGIMQIPRIEASEYAVKLGFKVHSEPSSKTDFIILGSENVSPSKVAKAFEMNSAGANIRFVDEMTFLSMISEEILTKL